MVETFGASTLAVAVAEIGDKTQLLAILLAARFRRPFAILAGILIATLLNHAAAAALGYFAADWLNGAPFQLFIGAAFLAMAGWALIPDKDDGLAAESTRRGAFMSTLTLFFIVEMGDKTQIATGLLAARFNDIAVVVLGTTAGMMLANAPAVWLGEKATRLMPLRAMRVVAAALFALMGVWVIADAASNAFL